MKIVDDVDIKIDKYKKVQSDLLKTIRNLESLKNTFADTDNFISNRVLSIVNDIECAIVKLKDTERRISDEIKSLEKDKLNEENSIS